MSSYILLLPVVISAITGALCLMLNKRYKRLRAILSLCALSIILLICIVIFIKGNLRLLYGPLFMFSNIDLLTDKLSSWIVLFVSFFGLMIGIYSMRSMDNDPRHSEYWAYLLWSVGASIGAVVSNDLILLLVFWGFLGLTLYLMVGIGNGSGNAAKKTFVIIGGADALMIFGVGIIWFLTGTYQMDIIRLNLSGPLSITAYLCLMAGSLAKAGAIPFHGWIPDSAEVAPIPVMALLPAAVDKLLGIYLLARISLHMFVLLPNSPVSMLLLIIGAVTIIIGVMMALVQHNLKKLLAYHAVSQVGYMVLGIGTGLPIGIAGGLFHMLNNAIYKSCLFLCAGAVEATTGSTELDKLGGLARFMPITFISCLISSLAISGIPPFNGFVSKWMIYQSLIDLGASGNVLWILLLLSAMFGSALTLASFIKVIHAVFLGEQNNSNVYKEVPYHMWIPMILLSSFCILFGVFAFILPLKYFIYPAVFGISYIGVWSPTTSALLLTIGLIAGALVYGIKNLRYRKDDIFIGGERYTNEMRVSGVEFYRTVTEIGLINRIYTYIKNNVFDIYEQSTKVLFTFSDLLARHHAGMLSNYLAWCFIGLMLIMIMLLR